MSAACYRCGQPAKRYPSTKKRGVLCPQHHKEASAKRYSAKRAEVIQKAKEWNKVNAERRNHRLRAAYRTAKDASIAHYGGKCRCGESRLEFLVIDHISDDGAEHRRQLANKVAYIHVWLKNNGYPSGFQVLCGNCNFKKEIERRRQLGSKTWKRNEAVKAAVMEAYGAVCVCCGLQDTDVLTMDHIRGGGSVAKKTYPSRNVYLFLKGKEPDRNEFQVMCQQCNQAKASYGECPHRFGFSSPE